MATIRYALVFSGQGSERVGMFAGLLKESDSLNHMVNLLKAKLGPDIGDLISAKDYETVVTNNQILLYVYHMLTAKLVAEKIGFPPNLCMGHSLGQFSAIADSGAVSFTDMAALIMERSKIINSPEIDVKAKFKCIHGMTLDAFRQFQEKEQLQEHVELALHNQKEQVVVAATEIGDERLGELCAKYNYIVKEIHVSRPYHTMFMDEYNNLLLPHINNTEFSNPRYPVLMNNSTKAIDEGQLLLEETRVQMIEPVFWYGSIEKASDMVDVFVVIDPGETQLKIIKRISNKKIYNVNNPGVVKMIEKRGLQYA